MNLESIDEFLYLKGRETLKKFFLYIQPGLDLSIKKDLDQTSIEIIEGFKRYHRDDILFQVNTSSLILDLFHIIELYLKSNLYKNGEHLIFHSIDEYPKEKKRWLERKQERENNIRKEFQTLIKSWAVKKGNSKKGASEFASLILKEEEKILRRSVSATVALERLESYLNWDISDDFKRKFSTLVACRNEIVHFGDFGNITFACSAAIGCLFSLSKSLPEKEFPKFYTLSEVFRDNIPAYNEFILYIKWFEIEEPFIRQISDLLIANIE
jgi:hypothetical protein